MRRMATIETVKGRKGKRTGGNSARNDPFAPRRRGAFLVVTMICLILSAVLIGSLLKTALAQHRQMIYEQQRLQANWLAEAGLERAANRLASDSKYAGETWSLPPDSFAGQGAAEVRIKINPVDGRSAARTVFVEAEFPAGFDRHARRSLQATVVLSASTEEKKDE